MNINLVNLKDKTQKSINCIDGLAHIEGSDSGVLIVHISDRFLIIDVSQYDDTLDDFEPFIDENGELVLPNRMELIYSNY
jgi:hypothetical protein